MITWVTVWVLTVGYFDTDYNRGGSATYQLQYASQKVCEKQRTKHLEVSEKRDSVGKSGAYARCDFQQVPVVKK